MCIKWKKTYTTTAFLSLRTAPVNETNSVERNKRNYDFVIIWLTNKRLDGPSLLYISGFTCINLSVMGEENITYIQNITVYMHYAYTQTVWLYTPISTVTIVPV